MINKQLAQLIIFYIFISRILKEFYLGVEKSAKLSKEIRMHVRQEIGPVFQPDVIQFVDALLKTRSGKIMRRILKAIASGTEIGNVTTLADPSVVDVLLEERKKMDVEVG